MKHPKTLTMEWKTGEKNLPKERGLYAVCCRDKKTKEIWYSFAEFIPDHPPAYKYDFDQWKVIGMLFGDCFARKSKDDFFEVIWWAKAKPENKFEKEN